LKNIRKPLLDIGKTKWGRKCIAIIIPLAVIAAVLSFGIKFISGPGALGHEISGADYFSPYTSLVFPVSGLYCDSYRLTKYSGSPAATLMWDTSWYILNSLPTLSNRYNFSIPSEDQSMIVLEPEEFYQWSFILHAGSRYEINSCVLGENDEAELWIIKGKALFKEWVVKKQCSTCTKYDLPPCNFTMEQNLMHNYSVSNDDEYYFVYSNPTHQLSYVQADMSFVKLEYSFDDDNIYCQCDEIDVDFEYYACRSLCSLPLTFNGYILLSTMPTGDYDINWEDKIYITWSCDSPYNYAYFLLFCLPFVVIITIVLICVDIIVPCLSWYRRRKSNTADTEQPAAASIRCSRKVLVAAIWFLVVLLMSLMSVCVTLAGLTTILTVITFIAKLPDIQGISNNKLKLCLLALSTVLFIVSLLCNKFRIWIQTKLRSIVDAIRQQRLSQIARNRQASNNSDTNSSALRANIKAHIQNQIMRIIFVCGVVPLIIVFAVAMSAMFTFLEGFIPVLATCSFEIDSAIFIPGDTQTFSFNSFFCSEYSISSYGDPHLSATLSMVNSDSVVGNYSVTYINSNDSISTYFFATWNFYLNEKSDASVKVCLLEDHSMESIVTFDVYQYDSVSNTHLVSGVVNDSCYGNLWQVPIGNISRNAGKYRIELSTDSEYPVQTHIEIELNRYLYFVPHNISNAQTCSVSSHTSDTCTAAAPSSTGSMTGIISVHSDQSSIINWHETLSVKKTSSYNMANWTALWLPVLLVNVAVFLVICGVIQTMKYKQIRKKLDQKEVPVTDSESERLIRREDNTSNNYGSNTVTVATDTLDPTGDHSANTDQASTPVVRVELEHTSDHDTTPRASYPVEVVAETEPTRDMSMATGPSFESCSAVRHEPSPATASLESISDLRDDARVIEHDTADTKPIMDAECEDVAIEC
jgi:hypothetical protein